MQRQLMPSRRRKNHEPANQKNPVMQQPQQQQPPPPPPPAIAKRSRQSKGLSKHGCITCKIRRIKCDETKPHCNRCLDTGRQCDGYRSNFVSITPGGSALMSAFKATPSSSNTTAAASGIREEEQEPIITLDRLPPLSKLPYLSRNFTLVPHCTSLDIDYYAPEAQATLDSVSSEPAIRHALACLDALGSHYQQHGDPTRTTSNTSARYPGFQLGLQEYTRAMQALSGKLSSCSPGSTGVSGEDEEQQNKQYCPSLRCALLCGQLFISIELALNDIHAAVRHCIQGLHIMHQYGTRCYINNDGEGNSSTTTTTTNNNNNVVIPKFADPSLPDMSLFVIKLFLTCPRELFSFADVEDENTQGVAEFGIGIGVPYEYAAAGAGALANSFSNLMSRQNNNDPQDDAGKHRGGHHHEPDDDNIYEEAIILMQARKHLASVAYSSVDLLRGIKRLHPANSSSSFSSSSSQPELPAQLTAQRRTILEQLERWDDQYGHPLWCHYQGIAASWGHPDDTHNNDNNDGQQTSGGSRNWRIALVSSFSTMFYLHLKLSATLALQKPGGSLDGAWEEQSQEMVAVAEIVTGLMKRQGR